MPRQRGGGSSAKSGGLLGAKAAPAPSASAAKPRTGSLFGSSQSTSTHAPPPPRPAVTHQAPPPAPAPVHMAPAPAMAQSSGGGMLGGIGGMVVQGMAMGTGSAIAHQAVNGVMGAFSGGSSKEAAPVPTAQPAAAQSGSSFDAPVGNGVCAVNEKDLYKCLKDQNGDAGGCQYYFDALRNCQENQKFA